jgi:hypothetical protein
MRAGAFWFHRDDRQGWGEGEKSGAVRTQGVRDNPENRWYCADDGETLDRGSGS